MIGYAYVVGDILHVEHLRHLRNCKSLCDKLIVGVLTDEAAMGKKPRPAVPFQERMQMVHAIRWVDAVVAQTTYLPLSNILRIDPDILFEYERHEVTRYPEFKGKVIVMPHSPGHSSTLIKERIAGRRIALVSGALSETELQLIQEHFNFTEGNEKPLALWVIGRPASGKTTVASLLRDVLYWRGHRVELVDGERMRSVLGGFYGFAPMDRKVVFEKYVDLNQILQSRGIIPVTATVGGSAECRGIVRDNLESPEFIYLDCPLDVAARRDQKGLYARAQSGELEHFAGVHLLFQQPLDDVDVLRWNSAKLNPLEIVIETMRYLDSRKLLRVVRDK